MIFQKKNKDLPPGQYSVNNWPILSASQKLDIKDEDWKLEISGLVENPKIFTLNDLLNIKLVNQISDFHCVTTWSMLQTEWSGILWSDLENIIKPKEESSYVLQYSNDEINYTTGTTIQELRKPNVILAFMHNGKNIPSEHGGPIRLIIPQLYAYKSAKWLNKLEFLDHQKLGFWEERGYSEKADPFKEQRYTEDDENE